MTVNVTWKTPVPTVPDATFVVVDNIALSATEDNVRDFFAFCGTIQSLELQKTERGTQVGLIKFATADSAKTSLLLSNALINYEAITVAPLFPETNPETPPNEPVTRSTEPAPAQPSSTGKPALYIVHELLAAGYVLGEQVIARASVFDAKHRITERSQQQARSLDSQYKLTDYLQQWDNKFNLTKRATDAYNKLQSHPTGQKVLFTVKDAYDSALDLRNQAREIAERKRADGSPLFGKIPIPPAPAAGPSNISPAASGLAAGPVNPPPPATPSEKEGTPASNAASLD
ncbi:Protein vip1 [Linderina pennispora]|nr:Protein vip1 [Linderina pennispora]